jgi:hypothetical protein
VETLSTEVAGEEVVAKRAAEVAHLFKDKAWVVKCILDGIQIVALLII